MPIMVRDDKAPPTPMPLSEGQALSVSSDPQDHQNDEEFCHRRTRRCDDGPLPCQHHAGVKQGPEPWRPAALPPTAQMRHRATDPMRQRMRFVHGPRRERRGPFLFGPQSQLKPHDHAKPAEKIIAALPTNFLRQSVKLSLLGRIPAIFRGQNMPIQTGPSPLEQRRKQTWRAIQ